MNKKSFLTLSFLLFVFCLPSVVQARIWAMPFSIDYGTIELDRFQREYRRDIRVRNQGGEKVRIRTQSNCPSYEFKIDNQCYGDIREGQSCRVEVRFKPYRSGYYRCNLYIDSSEGDTERISIRADVVRKKP